VRQAVQRHGADLVASAYFSAPMLGPPITPGLQDLARVCPGYGFSATLALRPTGGCRLHPRPVHEDNIAFHVDKDSPITTFPDERHARGPKLAGQRRDSWGYARAHAVTV
jgi:hypothetical protein